MSAARGAPANDNCADRQVICTGLVSNPDLGFCDNNPIIPPATEDLEEACSKSAQDCYFGQWSAICADYPCVVYRCKVPTDNQLATRDGPNTQNTACAGSGSLFQADVWYEFMAPCDGRLTIMMCNGNTYDSMLAVYSDGTDTCSCPPNNAQDIACNDDFCSEFGGTSALKGRITAGHCYLIRVGGYNDAEQGISELDIGILCGPPPVTPLVTSEMTKLIATGGVSQDRFGFSVAVTGDTLVVGARLGNGDRGSAYVYQRNGQIWTNQARLTASDGSSGDDFGWSVAISGDTIVVGAYRDDVGAADQGSAYVFAKPIGGWVNMTQTAKLSASDGAANHEFGVSVAVSDDIVVVGAIGDYIGPDVANGAAYVFVRPGGGWSNMTQTAKLTASDGIPSDQFGWSLSMSGDVVVVGARGFNNGLNDGYGSAYVFVMPSSGWSDMTQTAKLAASDEAAFDLFGTSVSVFGDTVVVGTRFDDICANTTQGSAYVFVKPGSGWSDMTQTAKLTSSDGTVDDEFGTAVSISGDTVVVGAPWDDIVTNQDQGAVYIFVKPGGGWSDMTQTSKLTAWDGAASDLLGFSVAIAGDTIVGGAVLDDIGPKVNQGSAYVYPGIPAIDDPPLAAVAPHDRSKNRYVSFVPNNGSDSVAFQIDKTTAPVATAWVGAPDANGLAPVVASAVTRVWPEPVIHVGDCEIVPVATYEIRATGDGGASYSAALTVNTIAQPVPKSWGDTVGTLDVNTNQWTAPNGVVNVNDFSAALERFQDPLSPRVHVSVVDVESVSSTDPCLNHLVNIADVFLLVKAFQGEPYPFVTDPAQCPPCP